MLMPLATWYGSAGPFDFGAVAAVGTGSENVSAGTRTLLAVSSLGGTATGAGGVAGFAAAGCAAAGFDARSLLVSSAANLPLNKPTASGSFDGARVGAGAAVGSLQVISSRPAASVSALILGSEAEVAAALVSSSGTQVISTISDRNSTRLNSS